MKKAFYLALLLVLSLQCISRHQIIKAPFGPNHSVFFLDSLSSAVSIIEDQKDHFFERITQTEMEIQMKKMEPCNSRMDCFTEYRQFLSMDVEDFSEEEVSKISEVFGSIAEMLIKINPSLINQDIHLIKTKGKHYGPSVFYTRENKIIIPANELEQFNKARFTEVMIHEFAHIFTRYNKEIRDELYQLIGFEELEKAPELPEAIEGRQLLNPDGTTHYYISLTTVDNRIVKAYPLLSSTESHYSSDKPAFFDYLHFELYELEPGKENSYTILLNEQFNSTIPFTLIPDFFQKITNNTNYIIHPDEIIADNLVYTVFKYAENKKVKPFSPEGLLLLEKIYESIIGFKP